MQSKPVTEIVIRPNQSWFGIDWRGVYNYRDLLFLLVRRDFLARYKQTILGPAWFILQPLVTTLVFTVVFSRALGISTNDVPGPLFYMSGLLGWAYFSQLVTTTGSSFISNAALFGKVYFPRLVVPVGMALSQAISSGLQLFTFLVVLFVHIFGRGFEYQWSQLLFGFAMVPLLLIHMALLGLGMGLMLASLTAKYRDFQHMVGFLVQTLMYASPIIYPFSRLDGTLRNIASLNPMAAVVENTRSAFLGTPTLPLTYQLISIGVAIAVFLTGVMLYQRSARTFIDTV
jgi:lipopolysaccharide transport system permease protein